MLDSKRFELPPTCAHMLVRADQIERCRVARRSAALARPSVSRKIFASAIAAGGVSLRAITTSFNGIVLVRALSAQFRLRRRSAFIAGKNTPVNCSTEMLKQPRRFAGRLHGCIDTLGRPAHMRPSKLSLSGVFSGESRQHRRHRQAPAIHRLPRKQMVTLRASARHRETRGYTGLFGVMKSVARVELQDVFVGGELALAGIGVEQRIAARCRPGRACQLPVRGSRHPARRCSRRARRTAIRHARNRPRTARGHAGSVSMRRHENV